MRVSDERYRRHRNSLDLALRLLAHEVHTHTISEWTGLTPHHVRQLSRSYANGKWKRHRGRIPSKLEPIVRSPLRRYEATVWAGICCGMHVLPSKSLKDPVHELPNLVRGHLLCDAFERFRQLVPWSRLTLDQAILIIQAVAKGQEIWLATCPGCGTASLVDGLSRSQQCVYCATALDQSSTGVPPMSLAVNASTHCAECAAPLGSTPGPAGLSLPTSCPSSRAGDHSGRAPGRRRCVHW